MWGRGRRALRRDLEMYERTSEAAEGRPIRWVREGNIFRVQLRGFEYELALFGHGPDPERLPVTSARTSPVEETPTPGSIYIGTHSLLLYPAVLVAESGIEQSYDSLLDALADAECM